MRSATPPNLICTTPAPIPPSPDPRLFDWYDTFQKYLDFSLAGAPTIQSNDVQSILRSLVVPLPNYEDECRSLSDWPMETSYAIFRWALQTKNFLNLLVIVGLGRVPGFLTTRAEAFTASGVYRLQKFLRYVVDKFLDRLGNHTYSLPSLDSSEKFRVLWVARIAGTIYRLSGRRGEAIRLLETIIPLVIQHLDLKETYVWLIYNEMLIELAYCCAEDGHGREARHLLNNKLDWPCNLNRRATKTVLGRLSVESLREKLQDCKECALQLVGQLEKDRVGTHSMHEHHAQLQEGSSQPETSEWGPFLTDRVDWDKI